MQVWRKWCNKLRGRLPGFPTISAIAVSKRWIILRKAPTRLAPRGVSLVATKVQAARCTHESKLSTFKSLCQHKLQKTKRHIMQKMYRKHLLFHTTLFRKSEQSNIHQYGTKNVSAHVCPSHVCLKRPHAVYLNMCGAWFQEFEGITSAWTQKFWRERAHCNVIQPHPKSNQRRLWQAGDSKNIGLKDQK